MVLTPTTADARIAGTYIAFYNNANHSLQVGYAQYDCDHNLVSSGGMVTPYWTVESNGCILE